MLSLNSLTLSFRICGPPLSEHPSDAGVPLATTLDTPLPLSALGILLCLDSFYSPLNIQPFKISQAQVATFFLNLSSWRTDKPPQTQLTVPVLSSDMHTKSVALLMHLS